MRSPASIWSRIASWSASGMPNSMPMVRIGIWAPRCVMKSNPSSPTSGSRVMAQNSRTFGSMAPIFRGVNTRDSRPRCRSCSGGSSKMNVPGGISMSALMSSSNEPFAELYVRGFFNPSSTSSKRLSAKKSYFSL